MWDNAVKIIFIVSMLVFAGACQSEDYLVQSTDADKHDMDATFYVYGACDARVVSDRDKGIDISSESKFFRPAVFKIRVEAGVPAEVEMLMLASYDNEDEGLLYQERSKLLRMEVVPQPDILLKDGNRTINRYRGDSLEQQGSIDINWYAETNLNLTAEERAERVVHVDFASDPYNNEEGVRRWGQHYVCHRNVGINSLDHDSYAAHVD